jgi:hypothetical protein
MDIADILNQYASRPTDTQTDFDEVSRQVPPEVLGDGIAQAFRSEQTPDFGNMIGSLFGGSNPQQRAGLLGQLIGAVGPAVLSSIAGGALGRMFQGGGAAAGRQRQVTPDDVVDVTPEQVREVATAAEKNDPGIMDRIGQYYAQHPEVVKVLGGTALAIALGQMATRMRR